jgi:hypothetical protein
MHSIERASLPPWKYGGRFQPAVEEVVVTSAVVSQGPTDDVVDACGGQTFGMEKPSCLASFSDMSL